jgi:hypothetical protein
MRNAKFGCYIVHAHYWLGVKFSQKRLPLGDSLPELKDLFFTSFPQRNDPFEYLLTTCSSLGNTSQKEFEPMLYVI